MKKTKIILLGISSILFIGSIATGIVFGVKTAKNNDQKTGETGKENQPEKRVDGDKKTSEPNGENVQPSESSKDAQESVDETAKPENPNIEVVEVTKNVTFKFFIGNKYLTGKDFSIDARVVNNKIKLNEINFPFRFSTSVNEVDFADVVNLTITPIYNVISVKLIDNSSEVSTQTFNLFSNENSILSSNVQLPNGYKFAQVQPEIINFSSTQKEIRIDVAKTVNVKQMLLHFVDKVNPLNNQDVTITNISAEDNLVNIQKYLPQNFALDNPTDENVTYKNEVTLYIHKIKKAFIVKFLSENNVISQYLSEIYVDETIVNLDKTKIPNNYELISDQSSYEYAQEIDINVRKKQKSVTIIYRFNNAEVFQIVEQIDVDTATISINKWIPEGYLLANDESENKAVSDKIIVNIIKENNEDEKQSLISKINENKEMFFKIEAHKDLFTNSELKNILAQKTILFENLESYSVEELNQKLEEINKAFNLSYSNSKELFDAQKSLNLPKLQELKANNYYSNDFEKYINDIVSSYDSRQDENQKLDLFIEEYSKFKMQASEMDVFKEETDRFLTNKPERLGYKAYLKADAKKNKDYDGNDYYKVPTNSKFDLKIKILNPDKSQNEFWYLKHLYKHLKTKFLNLKLIIKGRRPNLSKIQKEIHISDIDFDNNSISEVYSFNDNDERWIEIKIYHPDTREVHYIENSLMDANDYSDIYNNKPWIRTGEDIDNTPIKSEIVPNSIDDFWLFPRGYSIDFKGKMDSDLNYLSTQVRAEWNNLWNSKISNGQSFTYGNALWVTFLKFFTELNFKNSNFTFNKENSIFTKTFTNSGSFTYQIEATANQDFNTKNFNGIGGAFFDFGFTSFVNHFQIQSGQKVRVEISLNNDEASWKAGEDPRRPLEIIKNNNGDLSALKKLGYPLANYPFIATFYGKLTFKLYVDDALKWDFNSHQSSQSHSIPVFPLAKNETDNPKKVVIYSTYTKSAIG